MKSLSQILAFHRLVALIVSVMFRTADLFVHVKKTIMEALLTAVLNV
jgi:hypothetical protein